MKKATRKRWMNTDLIEMFIYYNRRYFDGKLPIPYRLSFCRIDGLGRTFRYRSHDGMRRSTNDAFGVQISSYLRHSRRLWLTTLVHEMIHLEQRNKFSCGLRGKHFNKRMKELAIAGAFDGLW